jgi:hypothetical protein
MVTPRARPLCTQCPALFTQPGDVEAGTEALNREFEGLRSVTPTM